MEDLLCRRCFAHSFLQGALCSARAMGGDTGRSESTGFHSEFGAFPYFPLKWKLNEVDVVDIVDVLFF